MSTLVHITPQLPPAIDGVGDYCWNLWKHSAADVDWQFLVARGVDATRSTWPEVKVREFSLDAASLANALEESRADTVVLHYVGYAYQPKGIPVWLPRALRQWRRDTVRENRSPANARRLIVMFHEMYARSSPLRSPFWVAPLARRIIRELVEASDSWATSCGRYFQQLTTEFNAAPAGGRIIPIPSNIPAPVEPNLDECFDRPFRVAVFGLAKTRLWSLERHWRLLRALRQANLLEHITLIGKRPEPDDERAWCVYANRVGAGVNWRKRFDLSTSEISDELAQHDLGVLANEPDILTKSGAFAAFATHGVIPIVSTPKRESLPENLRNAVLVNDDGATIPQLVQSVCDAASVQLHREKLVEFARRELAWPGVARSWSELIEQAYGSRVSETLPTSTLPSRPAPSTLRPSSTMEVRA